MPSKKAKRVEGRWRLDFSAKMRKRDTKPENDEQRRARIKAWLQHNYPHVVRESINKDEFAEAQDREEN